MLICEIETSDIYGYWITDRGRLLPVYHDGDHVRVVQEHFDLTGISGPEAIIETALAAGWIRVVAYSAGPHTDAEFSAETHGSSTASGASTALFRFVRDFPEEPHLRYYHSDEAVGIQTAYDTPMQFISGVRQSLG